MLQWVRSFGRPQPGDGVKVTDGPYAGQPGVIRATTADGRYSVFIDECCQPELAANQFTRTRKRDARTTARDAKLGDPEGITRRHEIESRDLGDGF
ncbi:MAG TPA: hypothetical protein VK838_04390 [Candidatus Limnocylindrales bacterium]|nr:hypothetical protein [Candidatus Limnocylindrales bacterium]